MEPQSRLWKSIAEVYNTNIPLIFLDFVMFVVFVMLSIF